MGRSVFCASLFRSLPATALTGRPDVNRIIYDAVAALGGSISAEHGLGQLKAGMLPGWKSDVELELMRTLKRAIDPQGRCNPGKIFAAP